MRSAAALAVSDTASAEAAARARAVARQQIGAASATAALLASLVANASDPFSDKTTLVGSLSAAQTDGANSDGERPKTKTSFAVTLADAKLPSPASLPSATAAKAAASYSAVL